jgi:uncharacterized protein YndB with AHSA1/START domain
MPGGFQISVGKTLDVSVERLYDAFADAALRQRWLSEPLVVRKATPGKSVRATWSDGTTVDANLYAKSENKSQVSLQHSKLPSAEAAAQAKLFWADALGHLKALLETE